MTPMNSIRSSLSGFFCLELELNKLNVVLLDPHSPKTKALRTGTGQRRKQTLVRTAGNMDEAFSPVTTPEDEEEEEDQHIKHVAGQPSRSQQMVCGQGDTVRLMASNNIL